VLSIYRRGPRPIELRGPSRTAGINHYGTFTLTADGHWSYCRRHTADMRSSIWRRQSLTDSFTHASPLRHRHPADHGHHQRTNTSVLARWRHLGAVSEDKAPGVASSHPQHQRVRSLPTWDIANRASRPDHYHGSNPYRQPSPDRRRSLELAPPIHATLSHLGAANRSLE